MLPSYASDFYVLSFHEISPDLQLYLRSFNASDVNLRYFITLNCENQFEGIQRYIIASTSTLRGKYLRQVPFRGI